MSHLESQPNPDANAPAKRPRRRAWVLAAGLALALVAWVFRAPLQHSITERAILANGAPSPAALSEVILSAGDPVRALLAAWNTGKIVHRQVAVRTCQSLFREGEELPPELAALALKAALDPDLSVRQAGLGILQAAHHAAYPALAAAQLRDLDPDIRAIGLQHLRFLPPEDGLAAVAPLLDDPEPLVVALSLKLLEKWSGEDFGVTLSETAPVRNEQTGLEEYREGSREKTTAGAALAGAWLAKHRNEFPATPPVVPAEATDNRTPLVAPDFDLPTIDGRQVRLSDHRGKVVLLNFWTTWCTACVSEIPALIALQERHADDVVILGVSLDFVPDSHGHIGGHAAAEDQGHDDGEHDDHEPTAQALKRVRQKVVRVAKARGINYPVLLDEHNEAGGLFNGGELPTTVIIDARGNVRRRFIGARSLPVFEAMIREAAGPSSSKRASVDG